MNHPLNFLFAFFSIPVCSIPILTLNRCPYLSTPPSDSACLPSFYTCPPRSLSLSFYPPSQSLPTWKAERLVGEHIISQRRCCQLTALQAKSCSPRPWVQEVTALFRTRIMQILIPFHSHLRLAGHEIRKMFPANKSFCHQERAREGERGISRRYRKKKV